MSLHLECPDFCSAYNILRAIFFKHSVIGFNFAKLFCQASSALLFYYIELVSRMFCQAHPDYCCNKGPAE